MSISSVSSNTPSPPVQKAAPPEAAEATRQGKDVRNDGDADDSTAAAPSKTPEPVVNSLGQTIGKNLNVTA